MLEVRNLYKSYRSKTGVTIQAINGVSVKFKKTGLVFIIGKSGCGKSTLLNLLGGLDRPDGGEIIINGTSSLNFSQSDFDSYRNTYVGFVFQEYNLLKDFSVGANIALALELKGEKATDEKINEMLKSVDLEGYGYRRINELSGGQKQRIAIARALVKNPEIILADEPSGALDSASAKMLFDTLKNLSKTKLVIVVSHDRDFAFSYGDRVIEMRDGVIISDEEKIFDDGSTAQSGLANDENGLTDGENDFASAYNVLTFGENEITIPEKYVLSEKDLTLINEYLQKVKGKTTIKQKKTVSSGKFVPFDSSNVETENETFKPVKSSMPIKCAVKMGASNLGIKRFRLVLTVLLSVISFTMFGLYDVMASFNNRDATINSFFENHVTYASYEKREKSNMRDDGYYFSTERNLDNDDIEKLEKDVGIKMTGVYGVSLSFENTVYDTQKLTAANKYFNFYRTRFSGFVELKDDPKLYNLDFSIAGSNSHVPSSDKEIAIPQFAADIFKQFGFVDSDGNHYEIENYEQLLGKKISLTSYFGSEISKVFTISGVFSTGNNFEKYKNIDERIKAITEENLGLTEQISLLIEQNEFLDLMNYSFNDKAVVVNGYYDGLVNSGVMDFVAGYGMNYTPSSYNYSESGDYDSPPVYNFYSTKIRNYAKVDAKLVHFFKDGKTTLEKDEVLVPRLSLLDGDSGNMITIDERFEYYIYRESLYDLYNNPVVKVVGYCDDQCFVLPEELWNMFTASPYTICFGGFNGSKRNIEKIVDYAISSEKNNVVYYSLVNHITTEIDFVTSLASILKKVFIWVGGINAVFSALLLSSFIALGVVNKKTEIGILRAIGARGIDVFKIFFSESGIIACINFVLSSIFTAVFSVVLNNIFIQSSGMLVTVMNFGIRQILLLLAISLCISAIASFLPVYKLAKKKPVDIILNK